VLQVWNQLPNLTRLVIDRLVDLAAEVISNVATTKMSVENVAIVFAPSFMRYASLHVTLHSRSSLGLTAPCHCLALLAGANPMIRWR